MAAFIQKLFKNRKSTGKSGATPGTAKAVPSPKADTPEVDLRKEQRAEQLQQLANTPTGEQLEKLAISGLTADIRSEAAGQLTDKSRLQRVQKEAKGRDKTVYQLVRQTLQDIRSREEQQQKTRERIQALVLQAGEQARSEDTKLYEARLDTLLKQWSEVEKDASAEQTTEFLESVRRCRERVEQLKSEAEQAIRQQEQQKQRSETLELLQTTLDELRQQSPEQIPSLASLDALQKTQENRWLEATRETPVEKHEQKTYENRMQPLRNYIAALKRLAQHKDELTSIAEAQPGDETRQNSARELIKTIDWPEEFSRPSQLVAAHKVAGTARPNTQPQRDSKEQKQHAEALRATLEKLDAALEAKQLKESRQLFKHAQHQLKDLDHRHGKPFQSRMQLLGGQLRELTDWQGFATEPKQIALCEQMEYLATQPMEPEAKAERIHELQNEWRELGGSSDRALWSRFKAASDKAYEPCKAYFSAKSGLKQANLEKRKAICEELETFLNNADWSTIDWKSAERIHQTARQEWKAAWPIEFRDNRPVQKRFDGLLKQLESPLDAERQKNEALKQDIVDRANALVDHEPLTEAMNLAKALQTEWKQIGITRHREDRKLWQAFRKACDEIFARRDARKSEQQEATREADERAEAVLAESQALDSDESDSSVIENALGNLKTLAQNAVSPQVRERVAQEKRRLTQMLDTLKVRGEVQSWQAHVQARLNGNLDTAELPDSWPSLASDSDAMDARELVIRAEILTGSPSPDSDQGRRMEIQVQRLADGMGNSGDTDIDKNRQLESLVANWCTQQPQDALDSQLAARLNQAIGALAG
ncbi:DUF349 domain-containing protein [uncultured Marinobacter sp.]|uniref:DUF349 domain-containing protein n=1 Tax=uncultured Marinobacter sp. TaxID=187379 RepID=UPI0026254EEA|nr:DUF349 domain-containing protein [uncultured Marinobacter sp.]